MMQKNPPFQFEIKSNPFEIVVPGLRALLLLSFLLILFTGKAQSWYQFYLPAFILLGTSLFLQKLMVDLTIPGTLLVLLGGVLVLIATGNLIAPIVTSGMYFLLQAVYRAPVMVIEKKGITLKKTLTSRYYNWQQLNNVVMKDQLLTLDFTNNQVLQLEISGNEPDEETFNRYCTERLKPS